MGFQAARATRRKVGEGVARCFNSHYGDCVMKSVRFITLVLLLLPAGRAVALEPQPGDLFVRVVDVGAGHSAVLKLPGDHYIVYDAGNYTDDGATAFAAVAEIVPPDDMIDLMVLSHSDSDHLGAVDEILGAYAVEKVIRSGKKRSTDTWKNADKAIKAEKDDEKLQAAGIKFLDVNLRYFEFPPGATYRFGDTFVTIVSGFHEPPDEWTGLSDSEFLNAGSIVMRVEYKGKSILFCGDTVGRHSDSDDPEECIASENFMVEMSRVIKIDSDVIIAPHHGGDNGSAKCFIEAVSPEFVIFPAGHHMQYKHPRATTAQRYLDFGVSPAKMFRTDRGDDEGELEWDHERIPNHHDGSGDDDVDIIVTQAGAVQVSYRNPG